MTEAFHVTENASDPGEGDRGGSSPDRSPNDDRSDVMNPNNPAHDADLENRGLLGLSSMLSG